MSVGPPGGNGTTILTALSGAEGLDGKRGGAGRREKERHTACLGGEIGMNEA